MEWKVNFNGCDKHENNYNGHCTSCNKGFKQTAAEAGIELPEKPRGFLCIECGINKATNAYKCKRCLGVESPKCTKCGVNQIQNNGLCVRCGADVKKCTKCGVNKIQNNGLCIGCGAELLKCIKCNTNNRVNNGLCLKCGANFKKCSKCNTKLAQKDGLCYGCGAESLKCIKCNTNRRIKDGLCRGCGAESLKCIKCGINVRVRDGLCRGCGAESLKCIKCGITNRVNNGLCLKCGAKPYPSSLCQYCKLFSFHKPRTTKEGEVVKACARCFYHFHPDEDIPRRYMKKENYFDELLKNMYGYNLFVHNKRIDGGCSRRRPDWFVDKLTYSLIIECDENAHIDYDEICENRRTMEIFEDLGSRHIVFIRFNPDEYEDRPACFDFDNQNNMIVNEEEVEHRFDAICQLIDYYLDDDFEPTQEIEMNRLFI